LAGGAGKRYQPTKKRPKYVEASNQKNSVGGGGKFRQRWPEAGKKGKKIGRPPGNGGVSV